MHDKRLQGGMPATQGLLWAQCHTVPGMRTLSMTLVFSALAGTYIDKKCPFTGNVSIRGRILTGAYAE